jgi:transposase
MYSIEVRKIIINIYKQIKNLRVVESITNISKSTISRWNNSILPAKRNTKINILSPLIIDIVTISLKLNPYFTISDIQTHINKTCKIKCSYGLVRNVIKNMNLTYKKPKFINCPNKDNIKLKTELFINTFKNNLKDDTVIASIDEIGFSSKFNPLFSWSTKGKPNYINITTPLKDRNNTSVCACITNKGKIYYTIQNGSFNKQSFFTFFKSLNLPENSIILLDNVRFHHCKIIYQYAKTKNWILLFTPPYSPWFNPIENIFSVVKNYFRKHKSIHDSFKIITKNIIFNSILSVINKVKNNYFIF